jgi:diguanylate cyclase (GGDEF)-like protein
MELKPEPLGGREERRGGFPEVSAPPDPVGQVWEEESPVSSRILVADDEDTLRMVISQVLRDDGHEVTDAANGEAALAAFRQEPFPVVVTDIVMGKMTGLELLKEVKVLDPEVVVVIMTSHASVETATAALREGAYDYLIKPFEDIELISAVVNRAIEKRKLIDENRRLVLRLQTNARALEDLNNRLREVAIRDGLTDLYNHRHFRETLDAEVGRCDREGRPCSIILIDVDHFKRFNDTHGHLSGDEALKMLAGILRTHISESSVAARYGGEEFILMVPEVTRVEALRLAETLRNTVEQTRFLGREDAPAVRLTISLGVASYPEDGENSETLINHADQALYRAKRDGRNQICCWSENILNCSTVGDP